METISFPGLGIDFNINRIAFSLPEFLGSRPIYWYGILIAASLLCGVLYFFKRNKEFGVDSDRAMDVVLVSVIFSVVGARLYYVLFSWPTYKDDLLRIFFIREGGLAIYGAIIGAFIGALIMCRIRRVKYLPTIDLAVGGLFIGQAIGRWGNFVNAEAFGSNTTMPWGMTSPSIAYYLAENKGSLSSLGVKIDPALPVHPTFLYESLWCLAGFLFIVWFTKRRRFDGQLSLIYLGWYGLGRFFFEGLRTDSLLIGSIRVSQMLAMICFLASAFSIAYILSKIKRESDDEYLKIYVNTEEGQAVLSGEFYKNLKNKKPQSIKAPPDEDVSASDTDTQDQDAIKSDDATPDSQDTQLAGKEEQNGSND